MVRIGRLLWNERNEEHVARHGVATHEVDEMVWKGPSITTARDGLFRVVGQSDGGRYLTAYVAPRHSGSFYVVTARDATPAERRSYRRR